MAYTLNPEAQLVFFSKVFGHNNQITQLAKSLIEAGVGFETAMYTLSATHNGSFVSKVGLTHGVTSLMKHATDPSVAIQNKLMISNWLDTLAKKVGVTPLAAPPVAAPPPVPPAPTVTLMLVGVTNKLLTIKSVIEITGSSLKEAKEVVETVMGGQHQALKAFPTMAAAEKAYEVLKEASAEGILVPNSTQVPQWMYQSTSAPAEKPVDAVIHLKDAKALGQKVHGTSPGSIYNCIAIGESVRVAARLSKGGSISIRVEWVGSQKDELEKLKEAGIQVKSGYGSTHFDAASVPMQRVIGAFLMGTGIAWKQVVSSGADLVIGDK